MSRFTTVVILIACAVALTAIGGYWALAQTETATFESKARELECGQTPVIRGQFEITPQDASGPATPKDAFDGLIAQMQRVGSDFRPSDYDVQRLDGQQGTLFVLGERSSGREVMVVRTPDFGPWWAVDAMALCDDLA